MTHFPNLDNLDNLLTLLKSPNDQGFFKRCWTADPSVYMERLKATGFEGLNQVLDAGCGFGQWTAGLARLNRRVKAIDVDPVRVEMVQRIAHELGLSNIACQVGSIESLKIADSSLDGIFSYSVIYLTDYRKTLREFYRVLQPGGLCYINTNGLGWYLFNLIEEHNATVDFSSRQMAIETLMNTMDFYTRNVRKPGVNVIMPSATVLSLLKDIGFEILGKGPDGTINLQPERINTQSFYDPEQYGVESVYEVLCRKPEIEK